MSKFKDKAKKFWEENAAAIIGIGAASIVSGIAYIVGSRTSYKNGFIDGYGYGACGMVDWLDRTFPGESNAKELYEGYIKTNPDKMVSHKGPGKWS